MEGYRLKQEGVHTTGPVKPSFLNSEEKNFLKSEEKRQLQQESNVTGGGPSCEGEDMPILVKHTAESRGLTAGGRSCEGEDSPVSVIFAASKHLMQVSHPSSACTSMEHPLHHRNVVISSPGLFHFNSRSLPSHEPAYAGSSMSDRVHKAFSKSNELTSIAKRFNLMNWQTAADRCNLELGNSKSGNCQLYNNNNNNNAKVIMKPWPNYSKGRMEWLNLQEDPRAFTPSAIHSSAYVQSHTLASNSDAEEADGFSTHSSRDQDEESVIDFFPSANRPSSTLQLRRRSYDRVNELDKPGNLLGEEDVKRVPLKGRRGMLKMNGCAGVHDYEVADEGEGMIRGGRVSSSSKWDDAERWLTCTRNSPSLHIINDLHFNSLPKADKHVSDNSHEPKARLSSDSHGSTVATREAGTEVGLESMRDMATQSTPTDWSRCDSPEAPNFSTGAEKTTVSANCPEKGTSAHKTSPPRHNTPARRSVSCSKESTTTKHCAPPTHFFNNGKLNLLELENCHLDKLKLARDLPLGTSSTWQLYPDEDVDPALKFIDRKTPLHENVKSNHHPKVNLLEARVSAWEDVERAKHIAKHKREEAKIDAWEGLQRAEANAEFQKLEVKLEKLRFEGREKIMGRLASAQRRAQEMRVAAEAHKVEQLTRVGIRANHIRKSGHLPSSTFNVVCSLTTKIKPTSNLSFS